MGLQSQFGLYQNFFFVSPGGYDRGECLNTVEAYDPSTNTWSPLQHMRSPRGRFDCSQREGYLYACGGSNGSHELKSAEIYDSKNNCWHQLPDMLMWRASSGVAMMDGLLYVLGGWSGQSGLADCEAYDTATGKWRQIPSMNTGRLTNPLHAKFVGGNIKMYLHTPRWDDTGCWDPFSCKIATYLFYKVNIYHGYWWPGDTRSQCISNHDIDIVKKE